MLPKKRFQLPELFRLFRCVTAHEGGVPDKPGAIVVLSLSQRGYA